MLGIDLNDAGLTAVAHLADEPVVIPLGDDRIDLPASLGWAGDRVLLGAEAAVRARLQPARFTDRAWEDLSHRPASIPAPGPGAPWSALAYRILAHAWERARAHADPEGAVVLAVPGHLLRGDAAGEEAIGLVLGMARDLGLPLAAVVDAAAAAAPPDLAGEGRGDDAILLELTRHAAVLTRVHRGDGHLEAGTEERRPGLGLAGLLDEFEPRLASLFLARTAFDVGHDPAVEHAFRVEAERLLSALVEGPEATIEAGPAGRPRRLAVDRVAAGRLAERTARRLAEATRAFAGRLGRPHPVLLGPQAARVPGLAELLGAAGDAVVLLPPAAAARGAARLARGWRAVSDLSLVPVLRRVPALDAVPLLEAGPGADAPAPLLVAGEATPGLAPAPRSAATEVDGPSHVVFRGLAYPLGDGSFAIGPDLPGDCSGMRLPASAGTQLPGGPLRLEPSPEGLRLAAPRRSRLLLNGAAPVGRDLLRPGDRLQLGPDVELILVRLAGTG